MPTGDRNLSGNPIGVESGAQYSITLPAFATDLVDINLPRGILLDADGNVQIKYKNATTDTLVLAGGIIHPILAFSQIVSSSLTVSQIHIIY